MARLLATAHCTGATATCNRRPQKAPISHHPQLFALAIVIARITTFSAILRMLTRSKISKATVTDRPITWYMGTRWHPVVSERLSVAEPIWCRTPLRSLPPSLGEPACSPPFGLCSPRAS
jgi:hypothetical protein